MLRLIQLFPAFGLPNASPFCLKVETYLRMVKLEYKNYYTGNPKKTPTGKFPALRDGNNLIADSSLIIDYLKKHYGDPLDQHLTAFEKAQMLALQRMLEEHTYWGGVYLRWIHPQGWQMTKQAFFSKLPFLLRLTIPRVVRKSMRQQIKGQGLGRLTEQQIMSRCKKDITALADFLNDKPFIMGDKPTSIDACVYGLLANILLVNLNSELKQHAQTHQNLQQYCFRIRDTFWSDDAR